VQVLVGIAVDGWWKVKQGHRTDAIFGPFLWLFTLITGILAALTSLEVVNLGSAPLTLMLAGVVLLVLTQGREAFRGFGQKSALGKTGALVKAFGMGLLSLYSVVGYVSDVLSYSRLMALGLGTGIIAYAVNIIAGIVVDLIPVVGIVFAILILIIGHLGNLGLSALGAFIHSGRLQYVEFFGKFLEGGGTAFKPLAKNRRYTMSSKEF
jgi:V/A-type H+-transporting ATPase subunit I